MHVRSTATAPVTAHAAAPAIAPVTAFVTPAAAPAPVTDPVTAPVTAPVRAPAPTPDTVSLTKKKASEFIEDTPAISHKEPIKEVRKRAFAATIRQFNFNKAGKFFKYLRGIASAKVLESSIRDRTGEEIPSILLLQVSNWVHNALQNAKLAEQVGYIDCVLDNVTKHFFVLPGIFHAFDMGQENCTFTCDEMRKSPLKRRELIECFLDLLEQKFKRFR